jgi:hypothetical protein
MVFALQVHLSLFEIFGIKAYPAKISHLHKVPYLIQIFNRYHSKFKHEESSFQKQNQLESSNGKKFQFPTIQLKCISEKDLETFSISNNPSLITSI